MSNRLLIGLLAATSIIALVVLTGRLPGQPESAQAGGWGVHKTADAASVTAGDPRPVHLQGDVDCDGAISAEDVLEILQFMAGLDQPSCGGLKVGHFYLLDR